MPAVTLSTASHKQQKLALNSLPPLLQTPAGLAIIEIQGTIHAPAPEDVDATETLQSEQTPIGRLEFPSYVPSEDQDKEGKWMKKVYLYIGRFQRLTGEVKKLNKSLVVIGKTQTDVATDDLEVLEVVKYKILFSSRPEPVGN